MKVNERINRSTTIEQYAFMNNIGEDAARPSERVKWSPDGSGALMNMSAQIDLVDAATIIVEDPIDFDRDDDAVVLTTRRAVARIALVAAETAARFQREGIDHDPMAWMMAPRVLFNGAAAIDACLGRDACLHAVLLHGLCIGLDAFPEQISSLINQEDGIDDEDAFDTGALEAQEAQRLPESLFCRPGDTEAWRVGRRVEALPRSDSDGGEEGFTRVSTPWGELEFDRVWDAHVSLSRRARHDLGGVA